MKFLIFAMAIYAGAVSCRNANSFRYEAIECLDTSKVSESQSISDSIICEARREVANDGEEYERSLEHTWQEKVDLSIEYLNQMDAFQVTRLSKRLKRPLQAEDIINNLED